jgi:hypothetical protein
VLLHRIGTFNWLDGVAGHLRASCRLPDVAGRIVESHQAPVSRR